MMRAISTQSSRTALLCAALLAMACATDTREPPGATLRIADLLGGSDTLHARAIRPRSFTFPRDHGMHPEFRTEWWYFTGNLTADDGRELGYQLTFFRSALTDSATFAAAHPDSVSSWRTRHAWMAHLAVSDARAGAFHADERFARAAAGLAGVDTAPFRVWLHDWTAALDTTARERSVDGMFPLQLRAHADGFAIDLVLERGKPIVLQGEAGLSRKGAQPGNASYYYSLPRMPTRGTITLAGRRHTVAGTSWLDREWSTSVLAPDIAGWDWLALQLSDSTELMLYRLRRGDGSADEFSVASHVAADGSNTMLDARAFSMTPGRVWTAADGTAYPVAWSIAIPTLELDLSVDAAFDAQELNLAVRYWEGMVRVTGTRAGRPVTGRGYLEMTGYAGEITEVRR
jgi:predicted secreted hydrolase